jgi:hypothetical protein
MNPFKDLQPVCFDDKIIYSFVTPLPEILGNLDDDFTDMFLALKIPVCLDSLLPSKNFIYNRSRHIRMSDHHPAHILEPGACSANGKKPREYLLFNTPDLDPSDPKTIPKYK